jgi:ankyrin repeat protein
MALEPEPLSPAERARHLAFLDAAKLGDLPSFERFLKEGGIDINFAEPGTGLTALHIAAARSATAIVRRIAASGKADFALKDNKGRTAAFLAVTVARHAALGRYLLDLEHGCGIAVARRRRRVSDSEGEIEL